MYEEQKSARGILNRTNTVNPCIQNSLKKLKIFHAGSAIGASQIAKVTKPKSILKTSTTPSVFPIGANLNSKVHTIKINDKLFIPKFLTIEKGDSVEFEVSPSDSMSNNYVICVDDLEESNLLKRGHKFKTTFNDLGLHVIKCSINYKMRGEIEVVIPQPKVKEWENPIIPSINNSTTQHSKSKAVKTVKQKSSTSLDIVREKDLTQKLSKVLKEEEKLENKSMSRKEMQATFNNYTPIMIDAFKEELKKEKPKTEEEKKADEIEEHKFIEQQRTSSLGSRAKSRSNKQTPESERSQDTASYNMTSNCFNKLDFEKIDQEDPSLQKISEQESVEDTQYSQSVESMSTYKPITTQSPFCMLFHTSIENPVITQKHDELRKRAEQLEKQAKPQNTLKFTVRSILPKKKEKTDQKKVKQQEDEVRLFQKEQEHIPPTSEPDPQSLREIQKELKKEKRRMKRRKYKHRRSQKLKEIKEMKPTEGESQLISIVNCIQD